jgi:hypothetical protein
MDSVTVLTADATDAALSCGRCRIPVPDGISFTGAGLLCEQCADRYRDAYLDWYDSR